MVFLRKYKKLPFLKVMFLVITLLTIVFSLILTYFLSNIYAKDIRYEQSLNNLELLKQISLSLDNILISVRRIPTQMQRNNIVQDFWYKNKSLGTPGFQEFITSMSNAVLSVKEDVDCVDSVYIYSIKNNVLINCNNTAVTANASRLIKQDIVLSAKEDGYYHFITSPNIDVFSNRVNGIQYMEYVFESFNKPLGIILINLNTEQLYRKIFELGFRKDGSFFVVNKNYYPILFDEYKFDKNAAKKVLDTYSKFNEQSGFQILNIENEELLVSHYYSNLNGLYYIFYMPTSLLPNRIVTTQTLLFIILTVFTVLTAIVYFLMNYINSYKQKRELLPQTDGEIKQEPPQVSEVMPTAVALEEPQNISINQDINNEENTATDTAKRENPLIQKALLIISANYNKNIGLTYMASELKISESYFSKLFKEELNVNFKEYLTSFRLQKAAELIRTTDLSIMQISENVGYLNYNQFSKMFKNREGMSPSKYKDNFKK